MKVEHLKKNHSYFYEGTKKVITIKEIKLGRDEAINMDFYRVIHEINVNKLIRSTYFKKGTEIDLVEVPTILQKERVLDI